MTSQSYFVSEWRIVAVFIAHREKEQMGSAAMTEKVPTTIEGFQFFSIKLRPSITVGLCSHGRSHSRQVHLLESSFERLSRWTVIQSNYDHVGTMSDTVISFFSAAPIPTYAHADCSTKPYRVMGRGSGPKRHIEGSLFF